MDGKCQVAAEQLIFEITSSPILAYPDFDKEFRIHTDASGKGLGAILYQLHGEDYRVVSYASRTLSVAESRYHPTKLEFLALRWALTEAFHEYVAYANHFHVYTDNNPLVYLMQAEKLGAYGERWVSQLAEYNFDIHYRPGIIHKDADCLSRIPLDMNKYAKLCTEDVQPDIFQAIMAGVRVGAKNEEAWRVNINSITAIPDAEFMRPEHFDDNKAMIQKEQGDDPIISKIIKRLKDGQLARGVDSETDESSGSTDEEAEPSREEKTETDEMKLIWKQEKKLFMKDGILFRQGKSNKQLVLPKRMRHLVYKCLHIDMGHLGVERVL